MTYKDVYFRLSFQYQVKLFHIKFSNLQLRLVQITKKHNHSVSKADFSNKVGITLKEIRVSNYWIRIIIEISETNSK